MINLNELKFERTVWAERKLAKLCPNNNIKLFGKVFDSEDTDKQFDAMEEIIIIMHMAYERKQKFLGNEFESIEVTKEMLDNLDEDELTALAMRAFKDFKQDGEVTVEAEPKKEEAEEIPQTTESTSTILGSSTSATA